MAGVIRIVLSDEDAQEALRSFGMSAEHGRLTRRGYGLEPVTWHLAKSGLLSVRFRWTRESHHDPKTRCAGFIERTFKRRLTADEYASLADKARRRLERNTGGAFHVSPA